MQGVERVWKGTECGTGEDRGTDGWACSETEKGEGLNRWSQTRGWLLSGTGEWAYGEQPLQQQVEDAAQRRRWARGAAKATHGHQGNMRLKYHIAPPGQTDDIDKPLAAVHSWRRLARRPPKSEAPALLAFQGLGFQIRNFSVIAATATGLGAKTCVLVVGLALGVGFGTTFGCWFWSHPASKLCPARGSKPQNIVISKKQIYPPHCWSPMSSS